ncbi:MAG: hypothetical protein AB1634_03095 [Thermodesulfobacteriota bacterium]
MQPDVPCWDVARALNDYRRIYGICEDCIVYLTKQENSILSPQDIETILARKGVCPLEDEAREHLRQPRIQLQAQA